MFPASSLPVSRICQARRHLSGLERICPDIAKARRRQTSRGRCTSETSKDEALRHTQDEAVANCAVPPATKKAQYHPARSGMGKQHSCSFPVFCMSPPLTFTESFKNLLKKRCGRFSEPSAMLFLQRRVYFSSGPCIN
jgi:hypothetical protein